MDQSKAFQFTVQKSQYRQSSFTVIPEPREDNVRIEVALTTPAEGPSRLRLIVTQKMADYFFQLKGPTQTVSLLTWKYLGGKIVATGAVCAIVIIVEGDEYKFWLQKLESGEYLTEIPVPDPFTLPTELSSETKAAIRESMPELSDLALLVQMSAEEGMGVVSAGELPTSLHTKMQDGCLVTGYFDEEGNFYELGRISNFVDDETLKRFGECCQKQYDRITK